MILVSPSPGQKACIVIGSSMMDQMHQLTQSPTTTTDGVRLGQCPPRNFLLVSCLGTDFGTTRSAHSCWTRAEIVRRLWPGTSWEVEVEQTSRSSAYWQSLTFEVGAPTTKTTAKQHCERPKQLHRTRRRTCRLDRTGGRRCCRKKGNPVDVCASTVFSFAQNV